MRIAAPAKINWFLSVLGRRDDGYHEIESLMQCVSLYDRIEIEPSDDLLLVSDLPLPAEENLVYRAALLLREWAGIRRGARIRLFKGIPAAAGLGGGSSDAAATLTALSRFWELNLAQERLREIGARLGSDVPFFIDAVPAVVSGRGETIAPVLLTRESHLVIAKPPVDVSTAWAYAALGGKLTKKRIDIKLFCHAFDSGDYGTVARLAVNDLEEAVAGTYPVIGELKAMLAAEGALFAAMSGSGSAVFGVFPDGAAAVRASERMQGHWCRPVRTLAARDGG